MPKLTDKYFAYTSPYIRFTDDVALLGAQTNGAPPQRIWGIYVEGEKVEYDGEASESYWLKAVLSDDPNFDPNFGRGDHFFYTGSVGQLAETVGAIASASAMSDFDSKLGGDFCGYRNHAQTDFDENAQEGPVENLGCHVKATAEGFRFRLHDRAVMNHGNVVTINGKFDEVAVTNLLSVVEDVQAWSRKCGDEIEQALKALRAEPAMAM